MSMTSRPASRLLLGGLLVAAVGAGCAFESGSGGPGAGPFADKADDGDTAQAAPDGLLPKNMTEAEWATLARRTADPRDDHPHYAYTEPPERVLGLPGEFEPAAELILGWAELAWYTEGFFAELLAQAGARAHVTVITATVEEANILTGAAGRMGIPEDRLTSLYGDIESVWMRDYGPLFVRTENEPAHVIDARYYPTRLEDDRMPTLLAGFWGRGVSRPPIDMEGGNLQSDGQGRCISTSWLLEQNWGRDEEDVEGYVRGVLREYFGCDATTFLPPLDDEGTGHVDMLAHITGPAQVMVGDYLDDDPLADEGNRERLDVAARRLEAAGFHVRRVPMPTNDDRTMWRTYTNALALNDAVLVPVYAEDSRHEATALALFAEAYPGREVVPIPSDDIIPYAGAIHCVTMTRAE